MNTVDLNHGYSAINAEYQAGNTSRKYKFIPTTEVIKENGRAKDCLIKSNPSVLFRLRDFTLGGGE